MITGNGEGLSMARLIQEYESNLGQLASMRAFILAECRRAWAAYPHEETLTELQLAAQETATNIVRHGYQDQTHGPIRLEIDIDSDRVCLVFSYRGREFHPEQVPPPTFDGSRTGGFGVYLI